MLHAVDRAAYHLQHLSFLLQATVYQETARLLARQPRPSISKEVLRELQQRSRALSEEDLHNVELGHYPRSLLFSMPLGDYARALPSLVRDMPRMLQRKREENYKDLPADVDRARYPAYYRRAFHWQTDGYLSDHSARVYELGVELLFRGTADVMRRQIIPPISEFLRQRATTQPPQPARLLDVACGTGSALKQLAAAHPQLSYFGVDLSPHYARRARHQLRDVEQLAIAVENAEAMPFADASFDVVTCVYLFHELPRKARRRVAREMLRVLRPGGLLVVEDSAQLADSASLEPALRTFPREFHEPFFDDYLEDDLAALFTEAGAIVASSRPHLVAKVVAAHKPGGGLPS
jgi:ubiquinone/menaquinone biosynthesis C-methylase UbiE